MSSLVWRWSRRESKLQNSITRSFWRQMGQGTHKKQRVKLQKLYDGTPTGPLWKIFLKTMRWIRACKLQPIHLCCLLKHLVNKCYFEKGTKFKWTEWWTVPSRNPSKKEAQVGVNCRRVWEDIDNGLNTPNRTHNLNSNIQIHQV